MIRRLIVMLCVAVGLVAVAETRYNSHISVGVKGGVAMSKMDFSPSVQQKMPLGVMGGVTFRYAEERHVGLIAELNIEQRGWEEDFTPTAYTYRRTLTYIQLPLLTHIFFGGRRCLGFFNLGPEIGYMISDKISANFDYTNYGAEPDFPVDNRHLVQMNMEVSNRFDYGITAGGGCEFYVQPRHSIALEARFYYGLGNIFPSSKKDYFSASRGYAIIINLAYNFRLK